MDEKIILDLLNKNFHIVINNSGDFTVAEKNTIIYRRKEYFKDIFITLVGDFEINETKSSLDVFYDWCEYLQRDIVKDLYEFLDTLDLKNGSTKCFEDVINKFDTSSAYSIGFLTKRFNEYYLDKFLIVQMKEFFSNFEFSKGSQLFLFEIMTHFSKDLNIFGATIESLALEEYKNRIKIELDAYLDTISDEINSITLINNAPIYIEKEIDSINDYTHNYLNGCYAKTHLNDKVDRFLTELVVTLGSTNWIVTWIGHGPIDKKRLLSQFIDENTCHESYISKKYHEWFEDAILKKSEKIMNISY